MSPFEPNSGRSRSTARRSLPHTRPSCASWWWSPPSEARRRVTTRTLDRRVATTTRRHPPLATHPTRKPSCRPRGAPGPDSSAPKQMLRPSANNPPSQRPAPRSRTDTTGETVGANAKPIPVLRHAAGRTQSLGPKVDAHPQPTSVSAPPTATTAARLPCLTTGNRPRPRRSHAMVDISNRVLLRPRPCLRRRPCPVPTPAVGTRRACLSMVVGPARSPRQSLGRFIFHRQRRSRRSVRGSPAPVMIWSIGPGRLTRRHRLARPSKPATDAGPSGSTGTRTAAL